MLKTMTKFSPSTYLCCLEKINVLNVMNTYIIKVLTFWVDALGVFCTKVVDGKLPLKMHKKSNKLLSWFKTLGYWQLVHLKAKKIYLVYCETLFRSWRRFELMLLGSNPQQ